MSTAQQLNTQFGIDEQLGFRDDASGLIVAEISNPQASASLCLQGAHLMTWRPRSQSAPVIWLSRDARLAAGKSIRGGVPVCWPWFGAHAAEPGFASGETSAVPGFASGETPAVPRFPAHGYARTAPWQVIESGTEPDGATRLTLRLLESKKTRTQWPHEARLELTVSVGETLRMELSTENTGESGFTITEALHAYFRVGDIGAVRVTGLAGCAYWDKAGGSTLKKQSGIIRFEGETDCVYINTAAVCAIEDDALKRRIRIAKSGSLSTVVWTPWTAKAERMGDLGQPDGWREMLCVESANAIDNALHVAAGTRHTLVVEYRAEPL